jgi:hypothetical protein
MDSELQNELPADAVQGTPAAEQPCSYTQGRTARTITMPLRLAIQSELCRRVAVRHQRIGDSAADKVH